MKQKMKKCLCLMLSFMFVLSNCTQLFAQDLSGDVPKVLTSREAKVLSPHDIELMEKYGVARVVDVEVTPIKAGATVPEKLLAKTTEDMAKVRHSLENLKFYADKVLKQSQFGEIDSYVLKHYNTYLQEVEDLYTSVINRTLAYNKYLNSPWLDGTGGAETIISRAARKYTSKAPRLVVNNKYALEEGTAIKAIKEEIGKVIDLGPKGVHYAANTAKLEKQMQMALNFLDERIEYYDHMLKGNTKAQKVLAGRVDDLITEGVITRERIINYVIENMKPEEVRFVGVLKQAKAGGMTRLQMARELRKYLTAIGSKRAKSPILGLMRNASYETLKSNLTPKTKKFIKDYPELLEEGNTAISSRIAKKGLRVGPVAVIGALLTAALITEIKSDNHFGVETVSNRKLSELQKSIDNGTAGDADIVMFYSNPQSDSLTNKDTKHFINSFTLAMNLEEAEKNFDVIDNILSDEALAANYDINANEKVQNELDAQLANISEKVVQYENML